MHIAEILAGADRMNALTPSGRRSPFVAERPALQSHWHDKAVWFVRGKRDRARGLGAGVGDAARAGRADQGAHHVAAGRLPGGVRAQRLRLGATGALGGDAAEHNRIVLSHPAGARRRSGW